MSRDDVALAVNSLQARTQDQLHIHISCVRPDVRSALKRYEAEIGEGWSRLPFAIAGDLYRARRLYGDAIDANPFELLAKGLPEAKRDMASQTLVVVGATFRDGQNGFYLLTRPSTVTSLPKGSFSSITIAGCYEGRIEESLWRRGSRVRDRGSKRKDAGGLVGHFDCGNTDWTDMIVLVKIK